jgi:hypothetical protein
MEVVDTEEEGHDEGNDEGNDEGVFTQDRFNGAGTIDSNTCKQRCPNSWHALLAIAILTCCVELDLSTQAMHTILFSVYTNAWFYKKSEEVAAAVVRALNKAGVTPSEQDVSRVVQWFYRKKDSMSGQEAIDYEIKHWALAWRLRPLCARKYHSNAGGGTKKGEIDTG